MNDPRVNLLDSSNPEDENTELVSWVVRFKKSLNTIIRQIRVWMVEHSWEFDPANPDQPLNPHPQYTMWGGLWSSAKAYLKNTMVYDTGWLMISNKNTNERPAPQPIGPKESDLPDTPAWTPGTHLGVVWSGHQYTMIKAGWIEAVDVWAPSFAGNPTYRVILADITDPDSPVVTTMDGLILNENAWTRIAVGSNVAPTGSVHLAILDALKSGDGVDYSGAWQRAANSNNVQPLAGEWNRDNTNSILRLNHTDFDGQAKQGELEAFIPGTTILLSDSDNPAQSIEYYVNIATPLVDSVEYNVDVITTGVLGEPAIGSVCRMNATVPVPQETDYVAILDYWPTNMPTFANVIGLARLSGVDQDVPDAAFGVRIVFQEATISEDWDLMALSDVSQGSAVTQDTIDAVVDIANHT